MSRASVLVADPPWRFGDSLPGPKRGAASHYGTLTTAEICAFPLPPLERDAVLFLWRVATQVREANAVMRAWGFEPTGGELKWVKLTPASAGCMLVRDPLVPDEDFEAALAGLPKAAREKVERLIGKMHFGMGRTVRNSDEVCIIGRRGKPAIRGASERSVFFAPMPTTPDGRARHSAKPQRFYDLVERITEGPIVELFARRQQPGPRWTCYGNELKHAAPL